MPSPFATYNGTVPEFIKQLWQRSDQQQGSRSTAISQNVWALGTSLAGLSSAAAAGAPPWLTAILATISCVFGLNFIASYWYFAIKNPDALRSEKFTLTKMAIEQNVMGDNIAGLIVRSGQGTAPRLPPPNGTEGDEPNGGVE